MGGTVGTKWVICYGIEGVFNDLVPERSFVIFSCSSNFLDFAGSGHQHIAFI